MAEATKLALGTVQFGLPYGVANTQGQVTPSAVTDILDKALAAGVDTLDTAIAYGESEAVLGRSRADRFKVITKLPAVPDGAGDVGAWVADQVDRSRVRLGVGQLEGVLLHRPEQLLEPNGADLFNALTELKASGKARKVGISIYEPGTLDMLSNFRFDLVQAPISAFDQRMVQSGWTAKLASRGVELHARSAFLQELLLMPRGRRPGQFAEWSRAWQAWDKWLAENDLTAVEGCLRYLYGLDGVRRVVVGVDSPAQLATILQIRNGPIPALPAALSDLPPRLLNPANWQKTS